MNNAKIEKWREVLEAKYNGAHPAEVYRRYSELLALETGEEDEDSAEVVLDIWHELIGQHGYTNKYEVNHTLEWEMANLRWKVALGSLMATDRATVQ